MLFAPPCGLVGHISPVNVVVCYLKVCVWVDEVCQATFLLSGEGWNIKTAPDASIRLLAAFDCVQSICFAIEVFAMILHAP
jgi:hypothetical protein